ILVEGAVGRAISLQPPFRRLLLSELLNQDSQLQEFVLDRVRYYFKEVKGYKYDEVNAVLAAGWDDLADVERRLAAVQAVRPTENFEPLAASFKRIKNILQQAKFTGGEPEGTLLETEPEKDLLAACASLQKAGSAADYKIRLQNIAGIRPQ